MKTSFGKVKSQELGDRRQGDKEDLGSHCVAGVSPVEASGVDKEAEELQVQRSNHQLLITHDSLPTTNYQHNLRAF